MNDNKNKKKSTNPSFYIALCCCVAVIGIVGYFSEREEKKEQIVKKTNEPYSLKVSVPEPTPSPEPASPTPYPTLTPTIKPKEKEKAVSASVSVIEEIPETEDTDILEVGEPEEFYEGETAMSVFVTADPSFIMPTKGKINEGFSGDNLVYNSAMDDWRTHNGIDISAEAGSDVLASADGTIDQIYTDYLGNTVVLDHKNGFKTKYSNLDTTESLTVGVKIKQGEFLAKVANRSVGESVSEPHLHFELMKNEKFVNPEEYFE